MPQAQLEVYLRGHEKQAAVVKEARRLATQERHMRQGSAFAALALGAFGRDQHSTGLLCHARSRTSKGCKHADLLIAEVVLAAGVAAP